MKTNRFYQTLLALLCLLQAGALSAQNDIDDRFVENDVVSLAGKKGFTFNTKGGDFLFKPYALIQASGNFNYYDDEDMDLSEVDRIANSGFAIPNALLGFSGKAFGHVTFNFTLNAEHADNLAALFIGQIRTENNAVVAVLHCKSGICSAENADSEQQSKYKAQNAFFHILSPFKNKAFRECIKRFRIAGRPK